MKKIKYLLPILAITLYSCGGGTDEAAGSEETTTEENAGVATGNATDLSQYGMDYTIVLPEKAGVQTQIMENNWGGIDIKQGEGFIMSIAYGEGDLDILKFDLENDLMYDAEILEESPSHMVYKRSVKGESEMAPEFHFFYVFSLDGDAIEIQNSKEISFSEEAVRNMLASAKSMKDKSAS